MKYCNTQYTFVKLRIVFGILMFISIDFNMKSTILFQAVSDTGKFKYTKEVIGEYTIDLMIKEYNYSLTFIFTLSIMDTNAHTLNHTHIHSCKRGYLSVHASV